MDPNFTWTTKAEKLEVVRYWWRKQRAICHLCGDREQLMEPYSQSAISPWAASIEHLIPKRENGPDTVGNVRLAHRWCNNVLGALWQMNQDRARIGLPPLTAKWALSSKRGQLRAPIDITKAAMKAPDLRKERGAVWRAVNAKYPKATRGTFARAIESGEIPLSLPRGATLPRNDTPSKQSAYRPPEKLTGLELARILRERHGPWPLA